MNSDGKYAPYSKMICKVHEAEAVVIIVKGGDEGDGFSITARATTNIPALCKAIRLVVDQMEKDHALH